MIIARFPNTCYVPGTVLTAKGLKASSSFIKKKKKKCLIPKVLFAASPDLEEHLHSRVGGVEFGNRLSTCSVRISSRSLVIGIEIPSVPLIPTLLLQNRDRIRRQVLGEHQLQVEMPEAAGSVGGPGLSLSGGLG